MKNWPLKKQVIGLVSVLLSLMLLLGGNGSLQQIIIKKNVDLLQSDALPGVETLPKIYGQILEIRGNVVASSLGGSHDQFSAAEQQARASLKDYENFLDVDEPQMYAATVRASNAYLQLCDQFADLNAKGMPNEARQLWSQSEPAAFLALRNAFMAEIDFNNGLAAKFSLACQNSLREDSIVSWVLLILCLAVGFLLVRFLVKQIDRIVVGIAQVNGSVNQTVSQLRGASDSVAGAASRVSASSQSLSQSSQEQAASLEQTSTSTQVITASTIRNAEHAQQATLLMGSVVEKINGAGKALEGLIASMSEIADSSDKISSVTEAIEQIAFQTNMLAINAAVEAAHAGAAGRGFAIVALEVRDLATRCAQAAKDTKALISRSVTSSSGGSDRVQQVAAAARTVAESALSAKTLIDEVSRSNSEHSRGVEQISLALGQMESTTQNTVANAEQTAAASRQLSDEAAHLQEIALALEQRVKGLQEAMLVLS